MQGKIDGKTAFTGGVNLADEYINQKEVYGHWKDTAVMMKGEAARSFERIFLQIWNVEQKNISFPAIEEITISNVPYTCMKFHVLPTLKKTSKKALLCRN